MAKKLTREALALVAKTFCLDQSKAFHSELFGVTDGKAVGTHVEHLFQASKSASLNETDAVGPDRLLALVQLSLLSVVTALVGYLIALPFWDWSRMFYLVIGTGLCAGGVATLNQWMESETDALMQRTADRPIPSGAVLPGSAFVLGWLLCIAV